MALRYSTISFLSDYGTDDEFVGVVKSVVRSIAPDTAVIDITHGIAPQDVRAGGLALARSAQYLCPGVVLAIVDPGVGGSRRAIAVEVGDGASVLVGPDNGLLAPAVAMVGGATAAVELTNAEYHLPAPGPTFAGRDIFAPAAAYLCAGVPLLELGTPLDPHELMPGVLPLSRTEGDTIVAEVLWVDRFGNLQLNVDPDEIEALGDRVQLRLDRGVRIGRRATTYDAIRPGEVGLVTDSYGLLSIAVDRGSAADELQLHAGSAVTLAPPDDDAGGPGTPAGATSPVHITPKGAR
jgi:S-adenosylmethionine hydrolase